MKNDASYYQLSYVFKVLFEFLGAKSWTGWSNGNENIVELKTGYEKGIQRESILGYIFVEVRWDQIKNEIMG